MVEKQIILLVRVKFSSRELDNWARCGLASSQDWDCLFD